MANDELCTKISQEYEKLRSNISLLLQHPEEKNIIEQAMLDISNNLKFLRNSCAKGPEMQEYIASLPNFIETLTPILNNHQQQIKDFQCSSQYQIAWQLLGNLGVQNTKIQILIWQKLGQLLLEILDNYDLSHATNAQLMILYNTLHSGHLKTIENMIFKLMTKTWIKVSNNLEQESTITLDFFYITMEYFVTKYFDIISLCDGLGEFERYMFFEYVLHYIKSSNENIIPITTNLLNYISKRFQQKSDCILRKFRNCDINDIDPREILVLLEIIAIVSGNEQYKDVFKNDHSLFLNVGSLLQQVIAFGKQSENLFTPVQKLELVAPNSKQRDVKFEHEVSFEFKTMLVRILANLLYKNRKNQEYVREASIIWAICDSTTVDARNPLIKEWSILAIRNLCDNCPENQEIIANLCKIGDVPNDIVKEINMDNGSMRIQPKN